MPRCASPSRSATSPPALLEGIDVVALGMCLIVVLLLVFVVAKYGVAKVAKALGVGAVGTLNAVVVGGWLLIQATSSRPADESPVMSAPAETASCTRNAVPDFECLADDLAAARAAPRPPTQ